MQKLHNVRYNEKKIIYLPILKDGSHPSQPSAPENNFNKLVSFQGKRSQPSHHVLLQKLDGVGLVNKRPFLE